MSLKSPFHVLIAGAGLAGPCLALSLAHHGITSTIFEVRPKRSTSGGSISLHPNGLIVLDRYAGVYPQLKAVGFAYNKFGAYTNDGENLGDFIVGDEEEGGYPALRILRTKLSGVLLDAAEARDGIQVKYGKKAVAVREDEHGVNVVFEDGEELKGDVLIGADGVHSIIRQHVLGSSNPSPLYSGICVINGFLPSTSAILPSPTFRFPAFMLVPSGLFMTIPIDPEGTILAWGINKTLNDRSREEWRKMETTGEAARLAKSDYDAIQTQPIRSLLDNVKDKETKLWATYSLPNLSTWHTKRVCLIGDAAHALPPNGQGSAMAFEDAAILTRLISAKIDEQSFEEVFEKFEYTRRPRISEFRKSPLVGAMRGQSGPWMFWVKKWVFRGLFWWSSGVVRSGGKRTYDVDKVDLGI